MKTPRKYNSEMAWARITAWCDRRERTPRDVRDKLTLWGIPYREREQILARLISESFVNEYRFATAFASDKLRFNHWGKIKIAQALRQKGVSERNITDALSTLESNQTLEEMKRLIKIKASYYRNKQPGRWRQMLFRYLLSKGFAPEEIQSAMPEQCAE